MADRTSPWPLLPLLILLLHLLAASSAAADPAIANLDSDSDSDLFNFNPDPVKDAEVLLKFKPTLSSGGGDAALIDWIPGTLPCKSNISLWTGVICENDAVLGLQLENMSLSGSLNTDALAEMPYLRTLSFMNNSFTGPIPDIRKMPALKSLFLSMNRFSGEFEDGFFMEFQRMKKVYMSSNQFSGRIPTSLTNLTWLLELRLDGNRFTGEIPDFRVEEIYLFNVSYNDLEGPIPAGLRRMNPSMFEGNKGLCGPPLGNSCNSPSSSSSSSSSNKMNILIILLVVIIVLIVILGLIFFMMMTRRRQKEEIPVTRLESKKSSKFEHMELEKMKPAPPRPTALQHQQRSVNSGGRKKSQKEEQSTGKLVFLKENRGNFELEDLLRSSAEVLGSGNFGSSYKAVLFDGPSVVVKRYKEMNGVGREDFQEHMRRLGRLSHSNLLPLVAYYYRKEEKLIITDYIANGSLAHMLHGNRDANHPPLDWPTRLKIVKGIARGLAYLYEELPMMTVPHGHLKSSNVLLDISYEPILSDYALQPVMKKNHAAHVMVSYKCPEYAFNGKPTKKSDVWSLGILILEILTGKFPANYLGEGKTVPDLVGWVKSVDQDKLISEVFDVNMSKTENAEGKMLQLLQIGLACCEDDVEDRYDIMYAHEKIEALKERDN